MFVYQRLLSPLLSPSCRFHPTCSQYAIDALRKYSFLKSMLEDYKADFSMSPMGRAGI